jgi:hypothetical protein
MTVKLAILKSGEKLISDIQEMVVEGKVVGYLFNYPQVVLIKDFESVSKNNEDKVKHSFDINLFPWIPLTSDKKIPVPIDWVVTLVEPLGKLKHLYNKNISKLEEQDDLNKNTSVDERSDSDQSN